MYDHHNDGKLLGDPRRQKATEEKKNVMGDNTDEAVRPLILNLADIFWYLAKRTYCLQMKGFPSYFSDIFCLHRRCFGNKYLQKIVSSPERSQETRCRELSVLVQPGCDGVGRITTCMNED